MQVVNDVNQAIRYVQQEMAWGSSLTQTPEEFFPFGPEGRGSMPKHRQPKRVQRFKHE
jgi:hypothetical protein